MPSSRFSHGPSEDSRSAGYIFTASHGFLSQASLTLPSPLCFLCYAVTIGLRVAAVSMSWIEGLACFKERICELRGGRREEKSKLGRNDAVLMFS